ncbi:EAL domain-containing protein [Parasulfuritortus cantonensis]|uniref:EAL domain-containing protein n=1 Tax=Parasulfuritortus cantonensis TaxID=2528202 RepID=A0A4V2NVY9_9PROT|nr:EAL domain-containing protein [Parasulfuritortus cantonensis]TCJ15282.1 EAL domain-containing protein [Parasulfuritortus cantonensis]
MSMYRQLWLSILVSALLALSACLLAALLNARAYLETELARKNHDNAVALALALNRADTDPDDVVVTATALFDSGHYEMVRITAPDGRVLVDRVSRDPDAGAPAWFVDWLPIRSLPGSAQLSGGWTPLGSVTLMSRTRFAYRSLWRTALTMTAAIAVTGLLGGVLVSLVLRRIRRPMQAVVEQARAITEHRFVSIPEPEVPEFRQLAAAMNATVGRLREQFAEDARRYENLRREANFDALTGLANRNFFLAALDQALGAEDSLFGALAIIRLPHLDHVNRELGRETADDMLRRVGRAIGELTPYCAGTYAGRLTGADFGLMLPAGCDAGALMDELMTKLREAVEPVGGRHGEVDIGHGGFMPGENPTRLLARVDAAVAWAQSAGGNRVCEAATDGDPSLPVSANEWRAALRYALHDGNALKLVHHAVRINGDPATHRECPLRIRVREDGDWLPARRFLPLAERLGVIPELDLAALALALDELDADASVAGLWLNLSARSIAEAAFRRQAVDLLERHPDARERLWLEVPESGGLHRLSALRDLGRQLKPLGCHLGLEHYGHHFNQVGLLYDLGLDFLKVDSAFVQGIDGNPGNQAFLSGLCEIAHHIGMRVYAEGVENEAELRKLLDLGFDGVTGVAVREV